MFQTLLTQYCITGSCVMFQLCMWTIQALPPSLRFTAPSTGLCSASFPHCVPMLSLSLLPWWSSTQCLRLGWCHAADIKTGLEFCFHLVPSLTKPFSLQPQERFTQDTQPHYIYSPREMTRWVRGIFEALRPLETLPVEGLIRVWAHEALRLFQDRWDK